MTRGDSDAKRRLQVVVFSWLLVASLVGASSVAGPAGAQSPEGTQSATTSHLTTTTRTPTALEPRVGFACDRVAVTARSYDSVTLVFADRERRTFRWSYRGRNVFFGTGENRGAVVAEVVVRRDGEQVTRRNPDFEACTGRTATAEIIGPTATHTTPGTTLTHTSPVATETFPATTATTTTGTPTATVTSVTTTATASATTSVATATTATLDWPTIDGTTTGTASPGTTVRGTTTMKTTIPTPTVTPRPVAGYPECSDEDLGLSNALSLTYENGAFTAANATEVGENRFRFTVGSETHELELVEIERNEAGRPVSVAFDATLAVDAVVVRSGPGANVYEFPEPVTRRANLSAPTDRNTGRPFVVEEIAFCYDPGTTTRTENGGGPFADLGLGLLVGRDATAAVGVAAAGLLALRRRRTG